MDVGFLFFCWDDIRADSEKKMKRPRSPSPTRDDSLSSEIVKKSLDAYRKLKRHGKPCAKTEWTVLATICRVDHSSETEVVAMATGTKAIGASKLRQDGCILRDTHAEILARRAFRRYLLDRFEVFLKNGKEKDTTFGGTDSGLAIPREDVRYVMYVSQAPCGDACITSCSSSTTTWNLQTGARPMASNDEKLDGVSQRTGILRTKPGRGDRTRSISCSDKLLRWTVLGLQGGLLSNLMYPVYLSAIVFPSRAVNLAAVQRALVSRLCDFGTKKKKKSCYDVSSPEILLVSSKENQFESSPLSVDSDAKSCDKAIIWSKYAGLEVVRSGYGTNRLRRLSQIIIKQLTNSQVLAKTGLRAGTTKKDGRATVVPIKCRSYICSASHFRRFYDVVVKFALSSNKRMLELKNHFLEECTYRDFKDMALKYQSTKEIFRECVFPAWKSRIITTSFKCFSDS